VDDGKPEIEAVIVPPSQPPVEAQGKGRSLLLVDDDPAVLGYLCSVFAEGGFEVRTAANAAACLDCVNQHPVNLVITDLVLRGSEDGLGIVRALKLSHPNLPVILMSGAAKGGFADVARRFGVAAILQKPVDPDTLLGLAEELLRKPRG